MKALTLILPLIAPHLSRTDYLSFEIIQLGNLFHSPHYLLIKYLTWPEVREMNSTREQTIDTYNAAEKAPTTQCEAIELRRTIEVMTQELEKLTVQVQNKQPEQSQKIAMDRV